MTAGQSRVLVLLLVLLGLEAVVSQPVRTFAHAAAKGQIDLSGFATPTSGGLGLPGPIAAAFGYSVGGLALIALAAVAPDVATTFVVLLIVLALVTHGSDFAVAGQALVNAVQAVSPSTPAKK